MLVKYTWTNDMTVNLWDNRPFVVKTWNVIQLEDKKGKYLLWAYYSVFEKIDRLDLEPSSTPWTPNLITIDDTWVSSTDNITNKANPITVTISSVANADFYQISTDDGSNWSDAQTSTTFSLTLAEWTYTVVVRAWNEAGVSSKSTGITLIVDRTAPTLVSAVRDSDTQITVSFSEDLDVSTITKLNDWWFDVVNTGIPSIHYSISAINPWLTNDRVILTVSNIGVAQFDGVTVKYTQWWNWTVSDVAWNLMVTDATWVLIASWA